MKRPLHRYSETFRVAMRMKSHLDILWLQPSKPKEYLSIRMITMWQTDRHLGVVAGPPSLQGILHSGCMEHMKVGAWMHTAPIDTALIAG